MSVSEMIENVNTLRPRQMVDISQTMFSEAFLE